MLSLTSILKQQIIEHLYLQIANLSPFSTNLKTEEIKNPSIETPAKETKKLIKIFLEEDVLINPIRHYIIGGSFKEKSNAENMIVELKKKKHTAFIVGKNQNGLIRVCYNSYTTKKEALESLSVIRKINKTAWILSQ